MNLRKLAETIELSMDIPDVDKKVAAKLILRLEKLVKKLDAFNKHLNVLYNPFKEHQTVSEESVVKYRGSLWKYLNQINENFDELRQMAVLCIKDLKHFSSDTEITEIISTFTDDFGDIEKQEDNLTHIIADWEAGDFRNKVITGMENLKKEIAELKKLIEDRMIDHINSNILSKSWLDGASEKYNLDISEQEPSISRLYKDREEKLKKMM
jgi:hypothetical protein